MKKLFLVLFMVFALTGTAFAAGNDKSNTGPNSGVQNTGNDNTITNTSTTTGGDGVGAGGVVNAYGGKGGSAVIEKGAIKNTFTPTNIQGQNNDQTIAPEQRVIIDQVAAPEQTVIIKSPTQLLNLPSSGVPELNFGNGRMYDATKQLPKFAIFGIKSLGGDDMIMEVLIVNANVKFKNLYKAILSDAKEIANGGKKTLIDVRYQVIRAEAQKSWHTGGSLGGGGSGVSTTGLSGGAGAGSIVPSFGGTKADDLFTIIFVQVQ